MMKSIHTTLSGQLIPLNLRTAARVINNVATPQLMSFSFFFQFGFPTSS